uniref:Uncharacterized protein n=1 Tax=Salmonella enterica subsp. enterica serovar Typhi str. 404ty TaxID=497977 RepID=A0A719STM2_SALTI|nr:hypothetical protein [Salmonella enterica subsp. enterica serovar Typhi str. 404ty]
MHNLEISTIAIFSAQYKNIEEAENAGALYSVDIEYPGNDSNLLIVFYVQIMPDDFVMQLHRF